MKSSHFSNLIYRIIGKPERWHNDYIDLMNQALDETDTFDNADSLSELALGEQLLSRLSNTNEALTAFYTLLDKNRFQMIILDENLTPIFHNSSADNLFAYLCNTNASVTNPNKEQDFTTNNPSELSPNLLKKLKLAINKTKQSAQDSPNVGEHLSTIDYKNKDGGQLYLRSIKRQPRTGQATYFYIIMMVDQARQQNALNPELVALYELTDKEQMVLLNLIHGKTIKTIAQQAFVTENTVKTHVKALFRKTGASSQADIVRLVLTHESQILDSYFDTDPGLVSAPESDVDDRTVTLKNGQTITYREYGPKNGDPVIVCHNGFGCRLSIPDNHDELCSLTNKRIIIPDRPGFGKTPFVKNHPKNWHKQLSEFVDILGLKSYDIIGNVLGCPIAVEYASHADKRLKRVILTSPVFVNTDEDGKHLKGIFVPSVRLVKASKRVAREIYELWLKSITLNLSTHYRSMVSNSLGNKEYSSADDKERFLDLLVDTFREGISLGRDGISHEMVYCLSPKKLDLSRIKNQVHLWWGSEDGRISQEGVENLASQFPNATLHIEPGHTEHIYYSLFEKIIKTSYDAPKTR